MGTKELDSRFRGNDDANEGEMELDIGHPSVLNDIRGQAMKDEHSD